MSGNCFHNGRPALVLRAEECVLGARYSSSHQGEELYCHEQISSPRSRITRFSDGAVARETTRYTLYVCTKTTSTLAGSWNQTRSSTRRGRPWKWYSQASATPRFFAISHASSATSPTCKTGTGANSERARRADAAAIALFLGRQSAAPNCQGMWSKSNSCTTQTGHNALCGASLRDRAVPHA